jgi:GNAT superfamily N-acetyltransferase
MRARYRWLVSLRIRPATVEDAAAIATAHMTCWKESYTGLLSPGFFDSRTAEWATGWWTPRLADLPADELVNVAEHDGRIVGFAGSGPSRDEQPARELELYFIYVLARVYGTGAGQRLLDATIGDEPASLWVVKENPRALKFYRRNGFEPDGAEKIESRWENLEEIRLVR